MPAFYLERPDKNKAKIEKAIIAVFLIFAVAVTYLAFSDYAAMPDPNASECKLGFDEAGCGKGNVCRGLLVECNNNTGEFKYPFTRLFFDPPSCRAEKVYKEICLSKEPQ